MLYGKNCTIDIPVIVVFFLFLFLGNHKNDLELLYDAKTHSFTVRKPDVPVNEEWTISFDKKIILATEPIDQ